MALSDGRRLGWRVLGDPDGTPMLVIHGTPGSSRQLGALDQPARDRGIAAIAPDRAGYGDSAYDRRRTIGSSARDIGELARHLNLPPCPVVGLSGGGPTALACGALLPGQVTAIATVGGVAPVIPPDPSLPEERLMIRLASRSEALMRAFFAVITRSAKRRPLQALDKFAGMVAEPDARLLRGNDAVRQAFLDDFTHPSASNARAAARDAWLFARAWDIDLADITVPVHAWHGTTDRNVPVQHSGVIAARCPAGQRHIVEGAGHLMFEQVDQIVASVLPEVAAS
jgi:pimeloyl-ACP methyl ester carboxylesterase